MARKTPEVNSSSTADMAFLLLCFFMMTTTMDQDKGLARRLPPMPDPKTQQENQKINERNIIQVKINSQDKVLASSKASSKAIVNISDLGVIVKEFIKNPSNNPNLSEGRDTTIEVGNKRHDFRVSKGVISLQNDRGTSYEKYIEVQNELVRVFNELRDEEAMRAFGATYADLNEEQQKIIKDIIPQMISEAEPKDLSKK
ncbi:MAG: biopolymer transporter ExbD [Bacteroidales bacterium]|nr:biopolymer transporter ExbD [Bacteroidales bacterium]